MDVNNNDVVGTVGDVDADLCVMSVVDVVSVARAFCDFDSCVMFVFVFVFVIGVVFLVFGRCCVC